MPEDVDELREEGGSYQNGFRGNIEFDTAYGSVEQELIVENETLVAVSDVDVTWGNGLRRTCETTAGTPTTYTWDMFPGPLKWSDTEGGLGYDQLSPRNITGANDGDLDWMKPMALIPGSALINGCFQQIGGTLRMLLGKAGATAVPANLGGSLPPATKTVTLDEVSCWGRVIFDTSQVITMTSGGKTYKFRIYYNSSVGIGPHDREFITEAELHGLGPEEFNSRGFQNPPYVFNNNGMNKIGLNSTFPSFVSTGANAYYDPTSSVFQGSLEWVLGFDWVDGEASFKSYGVDQVSSSVQIPYYTYSIDYDSLTWVTARGGTTSGPYGTSPNHRLSDRPLFTIGGGTDYGVAEAPEMGVGKSGAFGTIIPKTTLNVQMSDLCAYLGVAFDHTKAYCFCADWHWENIAPNIIDVVDEDPLIISGDTPADSSTRAYKVWMNRAAPVIATLDATYDRSASSTLTFPQNKTLIGPTFGDYAEWKYSAPASKYRNPDDFSLPLNKQTDSALASEIDGSVVYYRERQEA